MSAVIIPFRPRAAFEKCRGVAAEYELQPDAMGAPGGLQLQKLNCAGHFPDARLKAEFLKEARRDFAALPADERPQIYDRRAARVKFRAGRDRDTLNIRVPVGAQEPNGFRPSGMFQAAAAHNRQSGHVYPLAQPKPRWTSRP